MSFERLTYLLAYLFTQWVNYLLYNTTERVLTQAGISYISGERWWKLRTTTVVVTDIVHMIITHAKYTPACRQYRYRDNTGTDTCMQCRRRLACTQTTRNNMPVMWLLSLSWWSHCTNCSNQKNSSYSVWDHRCTSKAHMRLPISD